MLSELGRREDALEATQEAVEVYRGLAAARPDAFLPDLAMSLNNLGNRLSELGRREDALEATQEALDLLWPFYERYPARYAQWTATILRANLSHWKTTEAPATLTERARAFERLQVALTSEDDE